MKKTYLVKKNPMLDGEDNWIVMNKKEFLAFLRTKEGQERKNCFGKLRGCDETDTLICIECGEEKAKEWRAEDDWHDYQLELLDQSGSAVISYHAFSNDDKDVDGESMIPDYSEDIETMVLNKEIKNKLREAVRNLSEKEYEVIFALFLTDEPMSECEYARSINVSREFIHAVKRAALKKLKKRLAQFA